jgi:hypothetical protein
MRQMLATPPPRGDRAVLEDVTGRRSRWMRRLGRTATLLAFGWLSVLLLGGLGLTPVADLPFAEVLRPSKGPEPLAAVPKARRPSAEDLRPALPVETRTTARPRRTVASPPAPSIRARPSGEARRFVREARVNARRAPTRQIGLPVRVQPPPLATTTKTPPGQTRTAPSGRSALAPGHAASQPPGQSASAPGQSGTSPGRSASAPGQVKKTTTTTTTTATANTTTTVTTPLHGPKGPKNP